MNSYSPGFVTRCGHTLFGIWGWAVFTLCMILGLLAALLFPGAEMRARVLTGITRAIFVVSGTRIVIRGLENLPAGQSVVVANHASYVDGFLLKAHLPARFSFVIKGEVRDIPVAHFLFRRAGAKFVERFESAGSVRDARKIVKAAQGGESLAFFAEGTFHEEPGLGRFRAGAFVSAIKGNMPVVPAVISGTRQMMPSGTWLPRPVPLSIDILSAIPPDDPAYADHRQLAEKARQSILAVLDEPDLCAN